MTRGFHLVARLQVKARGCFRGAHAPSRAGFGATAETNFSIGPNAARAFTHHFKVREGEAPPPAREGACAPQNVKHSALACISSRPWLWLTFIHF